MTPVTTKLVLAAEAAPEGFDAWAKALGWALALDLPRGHALLSERVYKPEGGGDEVAAGWCEDHALGIRFLWLNGDPSLFAGLAAALPHYGRAELLERAASADLAGAIDAMRALTVLEAGATPSAEFLSLYERFATHESDVVRRVSIHLGWVGAWPEIAPLVGRQREADSALASVWAELAAVVGPAELRPFAPPGAG